MNKAVILLALLGLTWAQTCDPKTCVLPNCRCFDDPDAPGMMNVSDTPQIVMVTMEGTITDEYIALYNRLFEGANPNGCAIRGTFFVTDSGTDYSLVRALSMEGHEIGVHSTDGTLPSDGSSWIDSIKKVRSSLDGIGVDTKEVYGVRAPEFSFGGDAEMIGIGSNNMMYDSSCGSNSRSQKETMVWPFTLDVTPPAYPLCDNGNNVTLPFPGKWMIPVDDLHDLTGDPKLPCIVPSACRDVVSKQNAFDLFFTAFSDHYNGKRTPFMVVVDPTWAKDTDKLDGTIEFLQYIRAAFGDTVWIVPVQKAVQWIQDPTPLANLTSFQPWACSSSL